MQTHVCYHNLRDQNIELTDKPVEPLQAQGKTVVFVLVDGQLKGAIALADIVRPEAKQAIAALKDLDIRCLMLTGDNTATAKWVAAGALYAWGVLLTPAVGAVLMAGSTVVVAINARMLRLKSAPNPEAQEREASM